MDQDVDPDTGLAETRKANILSQRLLSTDVDVYRPPTVTPQVQTSTSASNMHRDLLQLCSQRSNSSTVTELMRRLKDEGLMQGPKYSRFQSKDQVADESGTGTWLRRPNTVQGMQAERQKSPQGGTHFSNDATSRSIPNAQYLARLVESSSRHLRQEKIHDKKAMGVDALCIASESSEKQAQMSGSDAELKSVSSEDLVEMETSTVTPRGGRSGRSRHRTATPMSKNLVSERKRRKKLNDGLYSLRALVPKISKMDKASIVGDAIDYVKELKQEVEDIELEISEIERKATAHVSVNESSAGSMFSDCEEREETGAKVVTEQPNDDNVVADHAAPTETGQDTKPSHDTSQDQLPPVSETRILNMEVDKLDEQMYQLKISCQKKPGVLVQLTRTLESLDLDVLNAYHISFQESVLNTFIIEMKNLEMQEAEDLRRTLLDVAAQHGLSQA